MLLTRYQTIIQDFSKWEDYADDNFKVGESS